ncbi:MAG TPA: DUF4870 domain-containing protein [Gemmatimonadota bacterium]|nr:DUF4870 domain-containing protein [Gemmatimonadota bacterium]
MNQETPPTPPPATPPPPPPSAGGSQTTSTGLDPKLAGLLCYILGPITGIIFFLVEKTHAVVRFHAAQSIVFGIAWVVLWVILTIAGIILYQISWTIGNLFGLVTLLVWLGLFIVWIVLLIKGYSGEKWKLPIVGDMAERMVGGA